MATGTDTGKITSLTTDAQGVHITSDVPDAEGQPTRYIILLADPGRQALQHTALNAQHHGKTVAVKYETPSYNGVEFRVVSITISTGDGASPPEAVHFPIMVPLAQKKHEHATASAWAKISKQPTKGLIELYLHVKKTGLSGVGAGSAMVSLLDNAGNTLFLSGLVHLSVGANDDPFDHPGLAEKDKAGAFDVPLDTLAETQQAMVVVIASDDGGIPISIEDLTHVVNQVADLLKAGQAAAEAAQGIAEAAVAIAALAA
jgi:hypothetical protein